ncbi:MAG TPA: MdtA/MuxA family multidrug efflux RND transporter periplasmic adaptor subunit [Candidatus Acidoferrum sp.]|nr:MdtA/MuxA family multidrug efflux RND transporter periplasmic adaptor subunit [Candidatus Acidoferrum sp.]
MAPMDSVDLRDPHASSSTTSVSSVSRSAEPSRWWIWIVVLVLAGGGFWYFRGRNSQANSGAAGGSGTPPGMMGAPGAPGSFVVPVVVSTATKGDLPVFFNGLGNVTAFNTVTVRSRVDGQIVKINFTEGETVREGAALIEIDPRPYQVQLEQADGQLAKDEAQLRDVQVDYERYMLLYKEGVIPKQQLDSQQAQVGTFEGAIKADRATIDNAKLQILYSHITAPISGRVGLRLVDMGNMVHATDTNGLLVITQVQPIAILFTLPQDQLPQVIARMKQGTPLTVEAYDRDNTMKLASGKLLTIDNQIDTTTGTYKLKAVFDNAKNELFPNQFVNVHLLVDTKKNVVQVPTTAILRGPQGAYVFAVGADNTVKIHIVTLAETTGNVTGITSGLTSGEVVVTDGQDKLQDGSKVDPRQATAPPADGNKSATNNANSAFASPAGGPAR